MLLPLMDATLRLKEYEILANFAKETERVYENLGNFEREIKRRYENLAYFEKEIEKVRRE